MFDSVTEFFCILADFLSSYTPNCLEMVAEISSCSCQFVYFLFLFSFCFTYFVLLLFGTYTLKIAMSSWWSVYNYVMSFSVFGNSLLWSLLYLILKCPCLFCFFFFWLVFEWYRMTGSSGSPYSLHWHHVGSGGIITDG